MISVTTLKPVSSVQTDEFVAFTIRSMFPHLFEEGITTWRRLNFPPQAFRDNAVEALIGEPRPIQLNDPVFDHMAAEVKKTLFTRLRTSLPVYSRDGENTLEAEVVYDVFWGRYNHYIIFDYHSTYVKRGPA